MAFPTETVYGLGARADRAEAVRAIFEAKGRPSTNPLIVHVHDREAAQGLVRRWPDAAEALAAAFWPGPLTLVLERGEGTVADEVTAGGGTVALRVPDHPAAIALLQQARVPVAAPSANRSTTISPTTAAHVRKTLEGKVPIILDAGPTGFGIESTIVDVTSAPLRLLRHGAIPLAEIARFGEVMDMTHQVAPTTERADAPGMFSKHYAPRALALRVAPEDVEAKAAELFAKGARVGTIERAPGTAGGVALADNPIEYAQGLYAALHQLDDAGCDVIVIAEVPEDPTWAAVRDRLRRATG